MPSLISSRLITGHPTASASRRAAGTPGTLRELRVRAYLDLLQERDSRAGPGGPSGPPGGNGDGGRDESPTGSQDPGPAIAAQVNLTAPAGTVLGQSGLPGEIGGFGLLDAQATRDLVIAAARHPDTRWCLTTLHPDGTAAAHGCATGRHLIPQGRAGPGPPDDQARDLLRTLAARLAPIARGHCDHSRAETGYQPTRKLEHLVNTRNARCSAPGCGRPAARCDKDHTAAWSDPIRRPCTASEERLATRLDSRAARLHF